MTSLDPACEDGACDQRGRRERERERKEKVLSRLETVAKQQSQRYYDDSS